MNLPHYKTKIHSTNMDKNLSIVEEHAAVAIDEMKLKRFLSHTKVWDYARMSEQDYKEMTATDRFALLQDYYTYMPNKMGSGIFVFVIFLFLVLEVSFAFSIKCLQLRFFIVALRQNHPTGVIDSAAANRINHARVITLAKQSADSGKSFSTSLVAESKNGDVSEIAGEPVWKTFGFFGEVRADFNLEEVNFPENSLFYINQAYLTIQKSKKIFYGDYCLIGQAHESVNPPSGIQNYQCKDDEVKYYRPKYDKDTGKFLGLYEAVGFLVVREDPFEVFLLYGYNATKSKILYSTYKQKISSSFSGTLFSRHIKLIENSDDLKMSQLFFSSLLLRTEVKG